MTDERLTDPALDRLFRTARSYNAYLPKPVPEALLREIWALASQGPTAANSQPARVIWCASDAARQQLAGLASAANARKILSAPVTAIIGMDYAFPDRLLELFPHVDARPWFTGSEAALHSAAMRNGTLQGAYLVLAARALGLDTGPMTGYDAAGVDAAFWAGTKVKTNFICSLGYGDPASLFGRLPRLSFEDATEIR